MQSVRLREKKEILRRADEIRDDAACKRNHSGRYKRRGKMEKSVNFEFRDLYGRDACSIWNRWMYLHILRLVLAYIGDCVYDLIIKSMVINQGNRQVQKLHRETSGYVQASAQSFMMRAMQGHLTQKKNMLSIKEGEEMQNPYPLLKTSLLQIIEEQRDLRHWSDTCI